MSSERASTPDAHDEQHFLFGMAKDRLVARCRWGGIILALSPVVPYEEVDGVPQFLWQLLSELSPASTLAAFSSCVVGSALFLASRWVKRPVSLAIWVLTGLVITTLFEKIGGDHARWSLVGLPSSVYGRPLLLLATLAGTGAGLRLAHRADSVRIGRRLLGLSCVSGFLFYVIPSGAEAPLGTLIRLLLSLPELPNFRFVLGALMLGMISGFPLLVALVAGLSAYRPPVKEPRYLALLATFGFPFLLASLVFRSLLLTLGDASLIGTVGSIALLTALLGLAASTLEVLAPGITTAVQQWRAQKAGQQRGSTASEGWPIERSLGVAASVVLVAAGSLWWLARPPDKGVVWQLSPKAAAGDEVFGKLVPAWSRARATWDLNAREHSSATSMVELKRHAHALLKAARPLDPGLEAALQQLTVESRSLDLAGRRWYRLTHEVNRASQLAALPYYVDPTVLMRSTRDGLQRLFHLNAYRIEAVRPVDVGGRPFATLHVRALGAARETHNLLGFSRDVQPFALVVLDEIEPFAEELTHLAQQRPPRCLEITPPGTEAAAIACGKLLARLSKQGPFKAQLTKITERHELQHQIDGPLLPHARPVLERLSRFREAAQDRVNRELSAYVAELTAREASPHLGLIHLFRFAMTGKKGTLAQVAVLAFEALSQRELGGSVFEPDRRRLAEAFLELAALDAEGLRARAGRAWSALYREALPTIAVAN